MEYNESQPYEFPPIDWLSIAIEATVNFVIMLVAMIVALSYMKRQA
jgi:hypothetical protein